MEIKVRGTNFTLVFSDAHSGSNDIDIWLEDATREDINNKRSNFDYKELKKAINILNPEES